ncbi:MAG: hypothetical protein AAF771_05565 [Pseudomonadota bacterium]
MPPVSHLHHLEPPRFDSRRVAALVSEFGQAGAERLVGRALEELAVKLNRVERAHRTGDSCRLENAARELALIAGQVGLVSLSEVAHHVMVCSGQSDLTAQDAVTARLIRLGERSLMSAWELHGAHS